MKNTWSVRPATEADFPTICQLSLDELAVKHTPQSLLDESTNTRVVLQVVSTSAGRVIGYLNCWSSAEELELTEIVVDSTAQRQGVGRYLLTWLKTYAEAQRCRVIHLEVRISNHRARALYEASGYVQVGRRPRYYRNGEDALLYSLELSECASE